MWKSIIWNTRWMYEFLYSSLLYKFLCNKVSIIWKIWDVTNEELYPWAVMTWMKNEELYPWAWMKRYILDQSYGCLNCTVSL